MKEAMLYKKLNGNVRCLLCNKMCFIQNGKRGFCGVRENIDGALYSLVYGKCCAYAIEPIEKKPFYHFFPGSSAFSFATVGCNFRCLYCQNWDISQPKEIVGEDLPPERIVELAGKCDGIAYTYTEPTIFFEYAHDTAKIAKEKGKYNVFVTNGYMTRETIEQMNCIDASRIDLKSFNDRFYREVCSATLEPVLKAIKLLREKQHIEIIALLIPTRNDSDDEIRAMSKWVHDLDKDIPLHFTAYYPAYKMTIPPTPPKTLERARKIALEEGLRFVYTGNVPHGEGDNTYCYNCNKLLIERCGFSVITNVLTESNRCPDCSTQIRMVTKLGLQN